MDNFAINTNGTSADEILRNARIAMDALGALDTAMRRLAAHPRDYQTLVDGGQLYRSDRAAYAAHMASLKALAGDLMDVAAKARGV